MSEEKLTVAELLARRNKEREASGGAEDRPRRRRHRSLEEGGISVAELTGSIPKVRADGPRRGAHAVSDEDVQQEQVAEQPAERVVPEPVEQAVGQPAEPVAEPVADERPAEAEAPVEEHVVEAAEAGDSPVEEERDVVTQPEPAPAEPAATTAPAAPAVASSPFAVPAAVPVDPRPVLANEETGEITFTFTKLRDARTGEDDIAEAGPMAREVLEGSMAYDDRPTSIIPVIADDDAATDGRAAASDAADADADAAADDIEPKAETKSEFRAVPHDADDAYGDYGDHYDRDAHGDRDAFDEHADAVPAPYRKHDARGDEGYYEYDHAVGDEAFDGPTRDDMEATQVFDGSSLKDRDRDAGAAAGAAGLAGVGAAAATSDRGADAEADAKVDAKAEKRRAKEEAKAAKAKNSGKDSGAEDDLEDNSLSIGLLIAQTIVGLLFGGLVFALFTMLWMTLPTAVVAVIAVAFAFGLVIIVNLLRRQRDRLTPVLAGIVGLIVSFAPWVLTML